MAVRWSLFCINVLGQSLHYDLSSTLSYIFICKNNDIMRVYTVPKRLTTTEKWRIAVVRCCENSGRKFQNFQSAEKALHKQQWFDLYRKKSKGIILFFRNFNFYHRIGFLIRGTAASSKIPYTKRIEASLRYDDVIL